MSTFTPGRAEPPTDDEIREHCERGEEFWVVRTRAGSQMPAIVHLWVDANDDLRGDVDGWHSGRTAREVIADLGAVAWWQWANGEPVTRQP